MVDHVRTAAGVRKYHEPIGSPILPHSHLKRVLAGHNVKGLALNGGTAKSPINVKGNVMLAARLIAQGKHVRLNKVDQIGTLLTDLLKMSEEAKRKHETLDLCRVSVPKTNLFCAQNKGIDRIKMPQLTGVPAPGSKAAALGKPGQEVDLTNQFEKTLREHGVKVTDTTLPAASFKATQDQLIGDKVAGIEKFMETAPKDSGIFEPIFVTRDHYIIDGHHRWAAMVALDAKQDGVLGNYPMKVRVVDMDIGEALAAANAFAKDWGIAPSGTEDSGPVVAKQMVSLAKRQRGSIDLAFNPSEPRDPKTGKWVSLAGLKGMDLVRHLRALPVDSHVQFGSTGAELSYSKHHGGFYQKGAAEEPISPESLAAVLGGTATSKSRVPEDYIGAKAEMLNIAQTLNSPVLGETGGLRSRISDLAAGHPELLDDSEVRDALKAGDIGLRRLVSGHDYKKSRSPEQKAALSAQSEAALKERQAKRAIAAAREQRTQLVKSLRDDVSDYEFESMFGNNTELGAKIRQTLKDHPELLHDRQAKAALADHPELSGIKPSYAQEARDYAWVDMDNDGRLRPEDQPSIHQEHEAQITSEFWHDTLPEDAPNDDQYAKSVWETYQNPQSYGSINTMLRTGKRTEDSNLDPADLRRYVDKMFADAGTTTKKPMTLYRAIRSSSEPGHNWAENFKPGTTFTDKGIMSCTAHGRFAQGWLNNDAVGNEEDAAKANDVVLEIQVPKGQRIVGGSAQFIETMLPPGTTLKIISNEKRTAKNPRNPLGSLEESPFDYTHVVAKVVKS